MNDEKKTKTQLIISKVRSTLMKFDIEIERVSSLISLYGEKMDLLSGSTKKSDLKEFTMAKITKENYEVYLNRIKTFKLALVTRINLIVDKYEQGHSKVFQMRYFEEKNVEDIAKELGMPEPKVWQIVERLDKDISDNWYKQGGNNYENE